MLKPVSENLIRACQISNPKRELKRKYEQQDTQRDHAEL